MNPYFETDYHGPASFYKLLALRQKQSPIFLERLLKSGRKRYDRTFSLNLSCFSCSKAGRLAICLISGKFEEGNIGDLKLHSFEEIKVVNNCDFRLSRNITLPRVELGHKCLVILGFRYEGSDSMIKGSTVSEFLLNRFQLLYRNETINHRSGNYYICPIELLPLPNKDSSVPSSNSFQSKQVKYSISSSYASARSWFNPCNTGPQKFYFVSKVKTDVSEVFSIRKYSDVEISTIVDIKYMSQSRVSSLVSSNQQTTDHSTRSGIFFHYVYYDKSANKLCAQVEKSKYLECPWCCFSPNHHLEMESSLHIRKRKFLCSDENQISSKEKVHMNILLNHLRTQHFYFTYEAVIDPFSCFHIVLKRNRSLEDTNSFTFQEICKPYVYWGGSSRERWFSGSIPEMLDMFDCGQESESINLPCKSECFRSGDSVSVTIINDSDSCNTTDRTNTVSWRQYYHARLGLPLCDEELPFDSDDDCDTSFELVKSNKALDEFEDVSLEEKELMKLWNTHIHGFLPYADAYVPMVCERFVLKFGKEIVSKKLRHNLLLHLISLWDFGLVRADDIKKCVEIVDNIDKSIVQSC